MPAFFSLSRINALAMLLVAATCVAVQYNDPDGWAWMLIYSFAVGVAALAVGGRYGIWCLAGATAYLMLGIYVMPWEDLNARLFGMPHWHMGPDSNEGAREAGGLFLLSLWMFALSWHWWKLRHAPKPR